MAGCGHAAAGIFGARSRMGKTAADQTFARRAADVDDTVVDLSFAADDWRRFNGDRSVDAFAADESGSAGRRPALDRQSSGGGFRQSCRLAGGTCREKWVLYCGVQS